MENSRRQFLKVAAITGAGVAVAPALTRFATAAGDHSGSETGPNPKALTAGHWGMVIDTRKFRYASDFNPIIEACDKIHNIPKFEEKRHEIKWIWTDDFKHVFPGQDRDHLPDRIKNLPFLALCNHCANPSCVRACPTQATFQREDGVVMMDYHRCIGCRFCMAACPFSSRSFNFVDPRRGLDMDDINVSFPTRMKGVVEKCNFCAERLAKGELPACVEASKGAILFGDLDDPESNVRKALRENFVIRRGPDKGTDPSVYYII